LIQIVSLVHCHNRSRRRWAALENSCTWRWPSSGYRRTFSRSTIDSMPWKRHSRQQPLLSRLRITNGAQWKRRVRSQPLTAQSRPSTSCHFPPGSLSRTSIWPPSSSSSAGRLLLSTSCRRRRLDYEQPPTGPPLTPLNSLKTPFIDILRKTNHKFLYKFFYKLSFWAILEFFYRL